MLLDKSKLKESAYIGEELFRNEEDEKEHQCMIVRKTVQDGVFTLEEALKAYEVEREDYDRYLAKNFGNKNSESLRKIANKFVDKLPYKIDRTKLQGDVKGIFIDETNLKEFFGADWSSVRHPHL